MNNVTKAPSETDGAFCCDAYVGHGFSDGLLLASLFEATEGSVFLKMAHSPSLLRRQPPQGGGQEMLPRNDKFGGFLVTRRESGNQGVGAIELSPSKSPPDSCI